MEKKLRWGNILRLDAKALVDKTLTTDYTDSTDGECQENPCHPCKSVVLRSLRTAAPPSFLPRFANRLFPFGDTARVGEWRSHKRPGQYLPLSIDQVVDPEDYSDSTIYKSLENSSVVISVGLVFFFHK